MQNGTSKTSYRAANFSPVKFLSPPQNKEPPWALLGSEESSFGSICRPSFSPCYDRRPCALLFLLHVRELSLVVLINGSASDVVSLTIFFNPRPRRSFSRSQTCAVFVRDVDGSMSCLANYSSTIAPTNYEKEQ